jgi:hypothetical protein
MTLDLTNIFSAKYLLSVQPGPFLPEVFKFIVPFFAVLIILGVLARKFARRNHFRPVKIFFTKIQHFTLTMGVLGLIYTFFRQQNVIYLSMPLWLLLWATAALVWGGFVLKYYFTDRPKQIEELSDKEEIKKYLPS